MNDIFLVRTNGPISASLKIRYWQDLARNRGRHSYFLLVVTPTIPRCAAGLGHYFPCRPNNEHCVARGALCDGHVNCVSDGDDGVHGVDESDAQCPEYVERERALILQGSSPRFFVRAFIC